MTAKNTSASCCKTTESQHWKEYMLLLAPTNLTALATGGQTIDSGLFNRRSAGSANQKEYRCSQLVELVLVDEYSMVRSQTVAAVDNAKGKRPEW